MNDLIDWLRKQLDEDERVARGAHGGWGPHAWRFDPEGREALYGNIGIYAERDLNGYHTTTAEHLVRHDPARVLAEVEAKRRILDEFVPEVDSMDDQIDQAFGVGSRTYPMVSDKLLQLLALPYATRDGYREEWKPSGSEE